MGVYSPNKRLIDIMRMEAPCQPHFSLNLWLPSGFDSNSREFACRRRRHQVLVCEFPDTFMCRKHHMGNPATKRGPKPWALRSAETIQQKMAHSLHKIVIVMEMNLAALFTDCDQVPLPGNITAPQKA
jgi:hypothetical protein